MVAVYVGAGLGSSPGAGCVERHVGEACGALHGQLVFCVQSLHTVLVVRCALDSEEVELQQERCVQS